MIARPPMIVSSTPITPTIAVVAAPTAEVPVIVERMLLKRRSTPPAKTFSSRSSAVYTFTIRTPPTVSVRRPVTSALITLRSRKIGRSRLKAKAIIPPKPARMMSVIEVSFQLV